MRTPPTFYNDEGNMVNYWRKDGQRILCAGDRNWSDEEMIRNAILHYDQKQFIDYIIEGEARGADKIAAAVARRYGITVLDFPADWNTYGRAAGPIRNQQMIDNGMPTFALLFHDDIINSHGTKDIMLRLMKHNILFEVVHH